MNDEKRYEREFKIHNLSVSLLQEIEQSYKPRMIQKHQGDLLMKLTDFLLQKAR
jgi:hypothetical protein